MKVGRLILTGCVLLMGLADLTFAQQTYIPDLTVPHESGKVVIKTRTPLAKTGKNELFSRLSQVSLSSDAINGIAPALPWVSEALRSGRMETHPLATLYILEVRDGLDLEKLLADLNQEREIIYAEPYYLYKPLILPNDPGTGSQYYLDLIRAFDAWNIEQGDTTITIGMLDTGIDYMHEDMYQNIQYNRNDPVNGTDDDGDGLTDNYFGWDIANSDNVPLPDTDIHGTTVAGVSSAAVNNNLGIAGIGYRTRALPIKIFTSGSNLFRKGYEAIALAADLGCQVINLSWGEAGAYSQFGEDIIRYAVLEKDVAIVAAGGNTNGLLDFYPASYPYVLSVGATDQNDKKTPWGTYSPYMDLTAPGEGIYTVFNDNGYGSSSGTSLSAPMVAAAVALVRARFPELNALQAMEKVRVNADNITSAQQNGMWQEYLGKGRLNIFNALTDITSPSLRLQSFSYNNGLGRQAFFSDTITLDLSIINYLYPSSAARIQISSGSPYVSLLDDEVTLPGLSTLGTGNKKVRLVLREDTPPETRILIRLDYSSGAYQDHEYLEFTTSPSWVTLDNGKMQFSVAADGNLGYAQNQKTNGVGLLGPQGHLLDNIGLVIRSETVVMDNIPVRQSQYSREPDFKTSRRLRPSANSIADHFLSSSFVTDPARSPRLPLKIEQSAFTWDSLGAVFMEYFITNTSDSALTGFQPAVLADFDLEDPLRNRLMKSADDRFQYTLNEAGSLFGGLEILGDAPYFLTALDKRNQDGNSSDLPPYISDEVKYQLFQKNKINAGTEGSGNDVAGFAGLSSITLEAGESLRFAFFLSSASSLEDLTGIHEEARELYAAFRAKPPVGLIARFCRGEEAVVDPAGQVTRFYNDPAGTDLVFEGDQYIIPAASEAITLYGQDVSDGIRGDIYRIQVLPADVQTDFSMSKSLVLLDENNTTRVAFSDLSKDAVTWKWTFGNGYSSTVKNPSVHFTNPGTYQVTLESSNAKGCSGMKSATIEVAVRNVRPQDESFAGCPGSSFVVDPAGTDSVHVYSDAALTNRIYAGPSFDTGPVLTDSLFYVTNLDGPYESLPAEIRIDISEVSAAFNAAPDTLALEAKYLLRLKAEQRDLIFAEWSLVSGNSTTVLGGDPDLVFDYSGLSSFTIRLTAFNADGCSAVSELTLEPAISATPVIEPVRVCRGETGQIRPAADGTYHFYAESSLTTLIGKGRSMLIPDITKDTVVYVVAIDNLLESTVSEGVVTVSDVEARFSLPELPVNLNENPVIQLTDASIGTIVSRSWTVDGQVTADGENFEFTPEQPGTYLIGLTVEDDYGCISFIQQTLDVVVVTSLPDIQTTSLPYPNPSSTRIRVPGLPGTFTLLSSEGRIVSTCLQCEEISVAGLKPGLYLLKVEDQERTRVFQVIVD